MQNCFWKPNQCNSRDDFGPSALEPGPAEGLYIALWEEELILPIHNPLPELRLQFCKSPLYLSFCLTFNMCMLTRMLNSFCVKVPRTACFLRTRRARKSLTIWTTYQQRGGGSRELLGEHTVCAFVPHLVCISSSPGRERVMKKVVQQEEDVM